jgi:hypothetical protein
MNKAQVCEVLHINEVQLSRLVKQNKIVVRGHEYDDFDIENLRQHAKLEPGKPLSKMPAKRSFRNDKVSRLHFDLTASTQGSGDHQRAYMRRGAGAAL